MLLTIIKYLEASHHATLVKPGEIDHANHQAHQDPLERGKQTQQCVEEEQKVVRHTEQTSDWKG